MDDEEEMPPPLFPSPSPPGFLITDHRSPITESLFAAGERRIQSAVRQSRRWVLSSPSRWTRRLLTVPAVPASSFHYQRFRYRQSRPRSASAWGSHWASRSARRTGFGCVDRNVGARALPAAAKRFHTVIAAAGS